MLPCSSQALCQHRHCPFLVVQACRLPARKTAKCSPAALRPFASTGIVLFSWFKPVPQQSRYPAAADPLQVQQAPEAVPMSFYGGSRLSFARPQTSLQLGHRPGVPTGHSCHSNLGYRPRQTLAFQQVSEAVPMSFIWRFKAAVCQASNVLAARSPPRSH